MTTELAILDRNGHPIRNSLENPSVSLKDPEAWFDLFGGGPAASGVLVNKRSALSYPPLWRALTLISGDIGRLPLNTYMRMTDGGKELDRSHPSYQLLRRRASPILRAAAFKKTLTWHAMLHGNGVAWIRRNGMGIPQEMVILNPETTGVAVFESSDQEVVYVTDINGTPVRLHQDDVFHIRGLSNNGIWGMSVLDVMRESLGLPIAARQYTARFFGSGSNQSGILMVPSTFSDEKIQNTLRMWNETATGLSKAHKVALLKENVKWVPTSVSPKDSETAELLDHEVRMVAAITGVPPHKLGDTTRTSYNSLEQEEAAYLQDGLDPWLHEWEEESDMKLLTEREQQRETVFHEFNRNKRLQMDSGARATMYKAMREIGVLSSNDILRRENMPTIGPEGDVRFRPGNWVPLDAPPDDVMNACRQSVHEILIRKQHIEVSKVLKSAERDEAMFPQWLDSFYSEHVGHLLTALDPVQRIAEAELGTELDWQDAVTTFVEQRKAAILDSPLVDGVFQDRIQSITDRFTTDSLEQSLFPKGKNNGL